MARKTGFGQRQKWLSAPVRFASDGLLGQCARLLLVCLAAAAITVFLLAVYRRVRMPIGWDTARYLDQTNLVSRFGLRGATHLVLPRPSALLSSRIGFPVSVLCLSSLLGVSTFKMAAVIPVIAATAAALGAGAFISYSLRRDVWDMVVVAVVVGMSTAIVRLMFGTYTDNLIAASLFTAVLIPLLSAVRDGRGFVAAIMLLAMGGLVHPPFYGFILATLALVVVVYLRTSWRAWRHQQVPVLSTPSARLAIIISAAITLSALWIYGLLGASPNRVGLKRKVFTDKMRQDVPLYWFPVTAPLAALGVGWAESRVRDARRQAHTSTDGAGGADAFSSSFALTLMLCWAAVAAAGVLGFYLGRAWPAHRFLAFLLPFPMFIAIAIMGVGRLTLARGYRILAVLMVLAGLAGAGLLARWDYQTVGHRGYEFLDVGKIQNATTAVAYLDAVRIPQSAPIVFLISDTGPQPRLFVPEQAHILRSVLPPERILHTYFYVGTAENFLAAKPTTYPSDTRGFNIVSMRFFQSVRSVIDQRPVAIMLASYSPEFHQLAAASPDRVVGPGVYVVEGPRPGSPVPAAAYPSAPRGWSGIVLFGGAGLVLLTMIGVGWAAALLPPGIRLMELLGLSMGFGFGSLLLAGAIADLLGIRFGGLGGTMTAVVAAFLGWIVGGIRLLRGTSLVRL